MILAPSLGLGLGSEDNADNPKGHTAKDRGQNRVKHEIWRYVLAAVINRPFWPGLAEIMTAFNTEDSVAGILAMTGGTLHAFLQTIFKSSISCKGALRQPDRLRRDGTL